MAEPRVLIHHCMLAVATETGVSVAQMKSRERPAHVVAPRQMAMTLAYELTGQSLGQVGLSFGSRHHSTVHHACAQVRHRIARRPAIAQLYRRCKGRAAAEAGCGNG